jgi:hypothetical protein
MSTSIPPFPTDATRVNYSPGMLLAASDFQQEQIYHRARLAAALARLHGFGTLAGLKVDHFPKDSLRPEDGLPRPTEELVVQPGIALDRLGRIVEVPKPQSLRLALWFHQQTQGAGAAFNAFLDAPANQRHFVADLFLRFLDVPNGLRPSFPEPAADATDALVPARTLEQFELRLVARDCDKLVELPLPDAPVQRFTQAPTTRRELLDALYASYPPPQPTEYPDDFPDPTAVFLSRILIRLADPPSTTLDRSPAGDVRIDDLNRPVLNPVDLWHTL